MKPLSYLPLIVVSFIACHAPSGPSSHLLNDSNLYKIDTVRMAVYAGDEKEAGKTLQAAVDLYKKGSDTAGSITLFKRSIFVRPTAKAYFELAGAYIATRRYIEGIDALSIAEKLGYSPLANVMFRYAYAYANMDNGEFSREHLKVASRYVELAIQMGYPRPVQFTEKNLFPTLDGFYGFERAYSDALAGGAIINPEKSLWDSYKERFPETVLPFTIDSKWIVTRQQGEDIAYLYERFIPEIREAKWSRGGGDVNFYVALLHREPAFIAVIYGTYDPTNGPDAESSYTLVTYDPHGKIIDRMGVAGRRDLAQNFRSFVIRPDLSFQVMEYQTTFKVNPDSAGYDSSNVSGEAPQPPVNYHITAAGKFERTGPALASR